MHYFNRMSLVFKFLFFTLACLDRSIGIVAQNACSIPNGDIGICVPLMECPPIRALYTQYNRRIPAPIGNQLRQAACNNWNGFAQRKICCLNSDEPRITTTTTRRRGNIWLQGLPSQSNNSNREKTNFQPNNSPPSVNSGSPQVRVGSPIIRRTPINNQQIDQRGLQILRGVKKCGKATMFKVSLGKKTTIGEFPWVALLKYETNKERPFLCGASLISDRYVLTAAHCIDNISPNDRLVSVRLGEHNLATETDCQYNGDEQRCAPPYQDYNIEEIKIPDTYKSDKISSDIALLKLDRPVSFQTHIEPICLPINEESKKLAPDQAYLVAGWGLTEFGNASSVMLKATLKHKNYRICLDYYANADVNEPLICASGMSRVHTCQGDSGGPLFFKNYYQSSQRYFQYGIVSNGGPRCGFRAEQPGAFTNVIYMLPWITQNID